MRKSAVIVRSEAEMEDKRTQGDETGRRFITQHVLFEKNTRQYDYYPYIDWVYMLNDRNTHCEKGHMKIISLALTQAANRLALSFIILLFKETSEQQVGTCSRLVLLK